MDKKAIINLVGKCNYYKWSFFNKILRKQANIGVSMTFHNGFAVREYIDSNGKLKSTIIR